MDKTRFKWILVLGISLAVLALTVLILNYFNILSLSLIYPKQLGWLPHKKAQQKIIPSSINYSADTFTYDVEKAKNLLTQYIKDTVKSEFLPTSIEIKQGLSIDGRTENIEYEFGSFFTTQESTVSANFHYKEKTNTPNDFIIFIQPSKATKTIATASLANLLLSSYFTNPLAVSDCRTKGVVSYCETFQPKNTGKEGSGIVFGYRGDIFVPTVFSCFIPKESKDYEKQTSCIAP